MTKKAQKAYEAPMSILGRAGVLTSSSGPSGGYSAKHDVLLKKDWVFTHGSEDRSLWTREAQVNAAKELTAFGPKQLSPRIFFEIYGVEPEPGTCRSDELKTLSTLKSRGWTEGAVKSFLGEPDLVRPNPHYSSGSPMRLYDLWRVERIEETPEWKEWRKASAPARKAAQARMLEWHERRRQERDQAEAEAGISLGDQCRDMDRVRLRLPSLDQEALRLRAIRHWEERNNEILEGEPKPEFLDRITVNWLRHACTDYDIALDEIEPTRHAYEVARYLKRRVNGAIAKKYPFLKHAIESAAYRESVLMQSYC